MISRFFIDRPVFTTVLSIIIILAGLISMRTLPVAQYPEIAPPTVEISVNYPGANAETVAQSLAAPIEQELSGTKNLIYFQSYSSNSGNLKITATFDIGSDLDIAAVEIQNRLKMAEPRLPQEAVRQGITVKKSSTNMILLASLNSDDPKYNDLFLSNYANIYIIDRIRRIPGVGDAIVAGAKDYSMRIWLNPDTLTAKGLTVTDVANAIREQNGLYAAGRIGALPNQNTTELTLPVITKGRLETPEEFEQIILRANPDGTILRLNDVGRVELGSQSYDLISRQNGKPSTVIMTYLQPGANALKAAAGIKQTLNELSQNFPQGVSYNIPYDSTLFIEISIEEVVETFKEAILLVLLVVFIFLGSWRTTLIPLLAVPVAIIGTFSGMQALGFTINSLTLFGLVLAIGIVVDDAIVVVENVERIMHQDRLPVREATIKAMEQVTGPVIAIVLVLSAVFLPVAFLGGLTGEMYRQFAVTIAISVTISGVIALTLSPVLCRILLKSVRKKFFLFRWFDAIFDALTGVYSSTVRWVIRFGFFSMVLFGVLIYATMDLFKKVPTGFIPQEDQGYIIVATMLPPGASLDRTGIILSQVEDFLLAQPEIKNVVTLGGLDILAGMSASTNAGLMFIELIDWNERTRPNQHAEAVVGRIFQHFIPLKEALVLPFSPPPVQGLGMRAGFEFQLQNRAGGDIRELANTMNTLLAEAGKNPKITGLNGVFNVSTPQISIELDRARVKTTNVSINEVFDTLQAYLGSYYVNDFVQYGRIFRVLLQAESQFRQSPENISNYFVRNGTGKMVPLSGLLTIQNQSGPNIVSRFNSFPSVQITGEPAPGYSTGDAMRIMEETASRVLPAGYGFEWSGTSYQEIKAGNQAPWVIGFGLVVVFLVLAAQYEKWILPFSVLLAVPFGVFGAILSIHWRGIPNDIYFQIGLLTLIGLSAKNAILIVEFCSVLRAEGKGLIDAATEAARLRLRPILMTSMAFILGVLPLAISEGAGSASRHSIGTGVMGGMIVATFLAIFFVPLFFVIMQWISELPKRFLSR